LKHFFSFLRKLLDIAETLSNQSAGWLVVFLLLLVASDVAYRTVAAKSIAGAYSLSEIIMVGICFLAVSYTQKQKGHVSMDFIVIRLRGKPRQFTEITSSLLSLIVSILLFYRSSVEAYVAVKIRLITSGIIEWPAWPLKIVVAFGFFMLCIRIAIQLNQQILLVIERRRTHVV
jgi:TRAP-type C4-dicarboxylate transport system permease small subunit